MSTCALCKENRELRNSQMVPKALYRLMRARSGHSNPNPVVVLPEAANKLPSKPSGRYCVPIASSASITKARTGS
jgi:hypothetical protein